MRALTAKGWGSLGALLVLAAVIAATAIATLGKAPAPRSRDAGAAALAGEVGRCGHLGQAAEADPSCQDAWRRSRARFLGRSSGARP
jgi:conjugative transfer region protein TrbK